MLFLLFARDTTSRHSHAIFLDSRSFLTADPSEVASLDQFLSKMALLSLLLFSLTVTTASSARIACFWLIGGSQYITMSNIMEELASKGHEVLLYVSRVDSRHTSRQGLANSDSVYLAIKSSDLVFNFLSKIVELARKD